MKALLIPLFLSTSVALGAAKPTELKPAPTLPASEAINDDMKTRIGDGLSLAPVLGYDPTYGVLLGAAFFRGDTKPPINNLDLFLYGTFQSAFALETKFSYWNREDRFYRLETTASSFYDAYFGEGNATVPSAKIKIDAIKIEINPSVWFRRTRQLSFGLLSEFRYRNETGVNGVKGVTVFGDDFTPIAGVGVQYDLRDHQVDTKQGQFYQAKLDFSPAALSTRARAETFVRLDLEARHFWKTTESLVLATQLGAGTSAGEPGYQFRYNLGGSRKLRGYQQNRLRGCHYYMVQGEARLSVLSWFSVVGFGGLGDVAQKNIGDFGSPKLTSGLGFRLGLPPDFIAKVRVDIGISRDETSFYLNFNEAF